MKQMQSLKSQKQRPTEIEYNMIGLYKKQDLKKHIRQYKSL